MLRKDKVEAIQHYKKQNYTKSKISELLHISRNTVIRYWDSNPNALPKITRNRQTDLKALAETIESLLMVHKNCAVVHRILKEEYGVTVKLRALQKFAKPIRERLKRLEKSKKAVRRIETPPGEYLQIDFATVKLQIAGESKIVNLFVATLAYSRRTYIRVSLNQSQDEWFLGIEGAFQYFEGIPKFIVSDNAAALVKKAAKIGSRYCELTDRYLNFLQYWGVEAIACYPRYPQSKGKVERVIHYIKNNGIAGFRSYDSLGHLQEHLFNWVNEVADKRQLDLPEELIHVPLLRFMEEAMHLRPIDRPPFLQNRELFRKVGETGLLRFQNNQYQLPMQYSDKTVRVISDSEKIDVYCGAEFIRQYDLQADRIRSEYLPRYECSINVLFGGMDPAQFLHSSLQRSFKDYTDAVGGDWSC